MQILVYTEGTLMPDADDMQTVPDHKDPTSAARYTESSYSENIVHCHICHTYRTLLTPHDLE